MPLSPLRFVPEEDKGEYKGLIDDDDEQHSDGAEEEDADVAVADEDDAAPSIVFLLAINTFAFAYGLTVTTLGLDERRQEMCNQYLVGETSLAVRCEGHFGLSRAPRGPPLPAKAGGGAAATIGQVTGVALDGRRGYYFIHRAGNTFMSTAPIARGPIVHVPAAGASSGGGRPPMRQPSLMTGSKRPFGSL